MLLCFHITSSNFEVFIVSMFLNSLLNRTVHCFPFKCFYLCVFCNFQYSIPLSNSLIPFIIVSFLKILIQHSWFSLTCYPSESICCSVISRYNYKETHCIKKLLLLSILNRLNDLGNLNGGGGMLRDIYVNFKNVSVRRKDSWSRWVFFPPKAPGEAFKTLLSFLESEFTP